MKSKVRLKNNNLINEIDVNQGTTRCFDQAKNWDAARDYRVFKTQKT